MGTFTCRCGFVIPDSSYPNELAGILYWEDEQEAVSRAALENLRAFLTAVAVGRGDAWLASHFDADFPRLNNDDAEAIDEIYVEQTLDKGRSVFRCPECHRLHVQDVLFENSWTCYEPAAG